MGVFWGKVTQKEQSFAHQIDINDNKSVTNSSHYLYDLQEVDEEEDNSMANESMALSQNTSINDKMNETFTIGDKTIGAEVTIDCDDCEEVLNEKPVWSDVNISFNKTCDQTIDKSCVDLNICHNQNEIHSYCNVIKDSNNDPIIDKSIERLIDESVVVSDPFSPTFLNTFNTNENIEKRSSSLGLINTENLLINSSPDIIAEEIITDLDNKLIIDDFEPNVSLIPKSTTPSIANELIDSSMDCIEVNALDLLSPFADNKLTDVSRSQSKTAEEVPITCSLVDITLPQKFASLKKKNIFNTSINSDVITPQKKDFSVNDSTLDFILNEIACNSAEDMDECNENEETMIESQPKDITSLQVIDECEEIIDNRFHNKEILKVENEVLEELDNKEILKVENEVLQELDNKETEEISEKLEQNNEIMEEINEKLDEVMNESLKYVENETPKSIKKEVKNITLRSSKKKVTFARSPLSHISRNIEPLIISSVEKSVQIFENKNNSVHKMSGIKPPLKIRQTPNEKLSSGKKFIDSNADNKQTSIKSSGIKPPQKTSRTPNDANNMTPNKSIKKKMHFENIVSPVAKVSLYSISLISIWIESSLKMSDLLNSI